MLIKTRAIVLHSIKYGESGLIVQAYTEHFGRQSLLVHGIRKIKSRINPYLFETLSILDVDIYRKESREIQNLKEVKPCIISHHFHSDIRRSTIALFLGELLYRTLREEDPNLPLFNYLFHAIQILDIAEKGAENLPIIFLMQFSKFLGIYPKNNTDLDRYKSDEGIQLTDIIEYSLTDLGKLVVNHKKRSELLEFMIAYYSDHLEGMGQIKSLQILREVFH
jgi:DNA repair protein RecO (recombination protein O)